MIEKFKKVKKFFGIIFNVIISVCVIYVLYKLNYIFLVDKKYLLFPVLAIVVIKIIGSIINKKYAQNNNIVTPWIIYYYNIINVGYSLSLIFLALYVGKDYFVKRDDFPSYLMLFLPSILYILSNENINNLLKIFNFDFLD